MKKETKDPKEKMKIELRIECVEGDGRTSYFFKDYRSAEMKLTRSQATLLMDKLEAVVETKPL